MKPADLRRAYLSGKSLRELSTITGSLRSLGMTTTNFDFWLSQRTRPDGTLPALDGGAHQLRLRQVQQESRTGVVHRLVWEHHNGPIPDGA